MKLVFATQNQNKIKEVRLLLPAKFELLSLKDIGCFEDIPETEPTLEGNAILKAQYVYDHYGYPGFADDTGLLVEALNGAPGVFSARYAGDQKNSEDNIDKILSKLKGIDNRKACFITVIALKTYNQLHLFKGEVKGNIEQQRRGNNGFGYDPIFRPEGYIETFAEMSVLLKNEISHRGRALKKLRAHLHGVKSI
ncbi:MAG: non-canonical purine NTP diphosphatase [Flavobacteriaceae bacterium]